jgi:hypothetical protein
MFLSVFSVANSDLPLIAFAHLVFLEMHTHGNSLLHIDSYLNVLTSISQHCQKIVKELTGWVIYSEDVQKFHLEITIGLVRHKLIHIHELDSHLAKAMTLPKGLYMSAIRFCVQLINQIVVVEKVFLSSKFPNVLEILSKIAQVWCLCV